ncbi:MAG: amidohydrolase/deacetylase family metallohydrolase [Bryobacteraceae bacterium]
MRTLAFSLCMIPAFAQQYDLLLKGGHVVDPKNGVNAVRDVAIKGDRVAEVGSDIAASQAAKTIDASGLYVTPGLVDIHAHVFAGSRAGTTNGGQSSFYPDNLSFRTGVTTMVDPGSSGWRDFPDFRRTIIERARTRVLAMLNIVGVGILAYELEQNVNDLNPQLTADMAKKHNDVVVGIKSAHWWAPNYISVERALEAGKLANIPVMVDFGYFLAERPYSHMVTELLRPGDMSTHCFRWPAPLLDANGQPAEFLLQARRRGVKFDVGHGGGSFFFRLAAPLAKAGFYPDSISTDMHTQSMNHAMQDMPTTMSKFLAMGMPLVEVVRASTTNPATQVKHPELGQIAAGSEADIAVFRLETGAFGFADVVGGRIEGKQRLGCEMTLRAGKIVYDLNARAAVPWGTRDLKYPVK